MPAETIPRNPPVLHISLEGYISTADPEFLHKLEEQLLEEGLGSSDELVFSGFDGTAVEGGEGIPERPYMFGMNTAGWVQALKHGQTNPARYAEEFPVPAIGIYTKDLLCEVDGSTDAAADPLADVFELTDIQLGEPLRTRDPDSPISGTLAHIQYPEASPSEALVGIVLIDP